MVGLLSVPNWVLFLRAGRACLQQHAHWGAFWDADPFAVCLGYQLCTLVWLQESTSAVWHHSSYGYRRCNTVMVSSRGCHGVIPPASVHPSQTSTNWQAVDKAAV